MVARSTVWPEGNNTGSLIVSHVMGSIIDRSELVCVSESERVEVWEGVERVLYLPRNSSGTSPNSASSAFSFSFNAMASKMNLSNRLIFDCRYRKGKREVRERGGVRGGRYTKVVRSVCLMYSMTVLNRAESKDRPSRMTA